MSKVNDKHRSVARVYSRSILELAEAQGRSSELLDELGEIVALMDRDASFAAFVESPLIDTGERSKSLERLFRGKTSDLLVDALQVLNRKGRLEILPTLYETYRKDHQDHVGRVDVRVLTAVPLADELRARLRDELSRVLGKDANLIESVDPSILGGLVLRVGDKKVDASVGRQIRDLRHLVHQRASHQIHTERLISG